MKKGTNNDRIVTEAYLDNKLESFVTKDYLDKKLQDYPTKVDFQQFKSDILSRFDDLINRFDQLREDIHFMNYDIRSLKATDANHEQRLTLLEKRQGE